MTKVTSWEMVSATLAVFYWRLGKSDSQLARVPESWVDNDELAEGEEWAR